MELMVSTLRLSDAGVLTLDTVPSLDLGIAAQWDPIAPVVRAVAGFVPSKVMPLQMAVPGLVWALSLFPDVLNAMAAHVLATVERQPSMRDLRSALFS
jgi:hypothetical protein